jgi:predicted PurR-regulated permease PerM
MSIKNILINIFNRRFLIYDSIFTALAITIFIIGFEIALYYIIINPTIQDEASEIVNNMTPISINLQTILRKNQAYNILDPDTQKRNYDNIKQIISDSTRQTVIQIQDDIKNRRKNAEIGLFVIFAVFIVITVIFGFIVKKNISWLQTILIVVISLIIIAASKLYLFFEVYSKLKRGNPLYIQTKINQHIQYYLSQQ